MLQLTSCAPRLHGILPFLPLLSNPAGAYKIAREFLESFLAEKRQWVPVRIELSYADWGNRWFYAVVFRSVKAVEDHQDDFVTIPILLNGKVGQVQRE